MEQKFRIFVKSKNADLTALTSETVIKDLLKFEPLVNIRRFIFWEVSFQEPDNNLAVEKLNKILNQSFYLANPNKEFYEIDKVKRKKLADNQKLFAIKTYNKDTYQKFDLIAKIKNKTKIELTSLKKNLLWEFVLKFNQGLDAEQLQAQFISDVLVTKSLEKGLIINPLFEEYSFLEGNTYYEFT